MSRYIDVDESYDQDSGKLVLFLVEEDGHVSGIYGDEDFALMNARDADGSGSGERVVVVEVAFVRVSAKEIWAGTSDGEDDDGAGVATLAATRAGRCRQSSPRGRALGRHTTDEALTNCSRAPGNGG